MKKKKSFLSVSLCFLLVFGLASCSDIPCCYLETCSNEKGEPSGDTSEHTEHTYEVVSTIDSTCTDEGSITYKCTDCDETYTDKVDALGHDYIAQTPVPATCGTAGYTEYICSRCNDSYKVVGDPATSAHTYGDYIYDPSNVDDGHYKVCSVCGAKSEIETHNYTYTDNNDGATHSKECECEYKVDSEDHTLVDGKCECGYEESGTSSVTSLDDFTLDSDGTLTIPKKDSNGRTYTSISDAAFKNETGITSVVIPSTIERIEQEAFSGCSNLKSVTLSEDSSLTYIGYRSFGGCTSLTSLEVPSTVSETGTQIFYGCSSLVHVTFPKDFGSLASGTFYNCSALEEFTLPENATSIKSSTFFQCTSLKKISIPAGVTKINDGAFDGDSALEEVTFEGLDDNTASLTSISQDSFRNCSSLKEINLPSTITDLSGIRIFYGDSSLEKIGLSEDSKVTSLGEYFIYDCSKLEEFTIPSSVTSIGAYAFYNCSSLTGTLVIPDGVTEILANTFYGCSGYTALIMGPNVTSIGNNAFNKCSSLVSVTLSAGVTLSNTAFWNCKEIITVYYYGDASSWESLGKGNSNEGITEGTVTVYYYNEDGGEGTWQYVDGVPTAYTAS